MNDWVERKVGAIFNVQLGKMLSKKAKEGPMFPYLANFNVQWGRFDFSKINEMHFTEREKRKYHLQKNDILMCEGGEVGRCAVWKEEGSTYFYQKALHRLRIYDKDEINPHFFCAYMQHICSNNALVKIVGETSIAHLTREKLIELKFPCPDKTKQDQIVHTLQTWDTAVEKTEALIAAKERQFGWLVYKLIEREKAEVPLAEICPVEKGHTLGKSESTLGYLEIGDVDIKTKGYQIDNKEKKPVSGAVKVPANTLLVSTVRPTRGAITRTKSEVYVSSAFCKLQLKNDFYFYCLYQKKFFDYLKARQSGATYPTVKDADILKFEVPALSEVEKKQIAETLNTARHEINLLKNLTECYRTQKRGLMQKTLTGDWLTKQSLPINMQKEILS